MDRAMLAWRRRTRFPYSIGSVFLLLIVAVYAGYEWGSTQAKSESIVQTQAAVTPSIEYEELQKQNDELKHKLLVAQHNYQIQLEAKKNLAEYLKLLQKNNGQLTRDMAIYHSISGNLPKQQNLHVSGFQVFATDKAQTFRYLILLAKQRTSAEYVHGSVSMTIVGRIGKKSIFLPVRYENSVKVDGLAFRLRDFQEFAGELSFPAGFIPEQVSFKLMSDSGKSVYHQEFPWKLSS